MSDTITRSELADALNGVKILTGSDGHGCAAHAGLATYPLALVNDLFKHVEKHREPEYEAGAVYLDTYGEKWQYIGFYGKSWYSFGSDTRYPFSAPKRPLRKMVPEDTKPVKVSSDRFTWNLI